MGFIIEPIKRHQDESYLYGPCIHYWRIIKLPKIFLEKDINEEFWQGFHHCIAVDGQIDIPNSEILAIQVTYLSHERKSEIGRPMGIWYNLFRIYNPLIGTWDAFITAIDKIADTNINLAQNRNYKGPQRQQIEAGLKRYGELVKRHAK